MENIKYYIKVIQANKKPIYVDYCACKHGCGPLNAMQRKQIIFCTADIEELRKVLPSLAESHK